MDVYAVLDYLFQIEEVFGYTNKGLQMIKLFRRRILPEFYCRPDVITDQKDQIFEINKRPECNKGDQVGQIFKN